MTVGPMRVPCKPRATPACTGLAIPPDNLPHTSQTLSLTRCNLQPCNVPSTSEPRGCLAALRFAGRPRLHRRQPRGRPVARRSARFPPQPRACGRPVILPVAPAGGAGLGVRQRAARRPAGTRTVRRFRLLLAVGILALRGVAGRAGGVGVGVGVAARVRAQVAIGRRAAQRGVGRGRLGPRARAARPAQGACGAPAQSARCQARTTGTKSCAVRLRGSPPWSADPLGT